MPTLPLNVDALTPFAIQTNDNGFLITGFSRSSDGDVSSNQGNYDFWTLKLDALGTIIWEKSFGFSGSDQAYVVKETTDNGFLLGGSLDVSASGGQGNSKSRHAGGDFWLIKIDENDTKLPSPLDRINGREFVNYAAKHGGGVRVNKHGIGSATHPPCGYPTWCC